MDEDEIITKLKKKIVNLFPFIPSFDNTVAMLQCRRSCCFSLPLPLSSPLFLTLIPSLKPPLPPLSPPLSFSRPLPFTFSTDALPSSSCSHLVRAASLSDPILPAVVGVWIRRPSFRPNLVIFFPPLLLLPFSHCFPYFPSSFLFLLFPLISFLFLVSW